MSKIKIDDIRKELEPFEWNLISEEYKNLDAELIFECNEGHRVYASWKQVRGKYECPVCKNNYYKKQDKPILAKRKDEIRILGLDQATYKTGWSLFNNEKLLKCGVFETNLDDEIKRDCALKDWMINAIEKWQIDLVGLEGLHKDEKGFTTTETLARLQGILMETLYKMNIPYTICDSSVWRGHCGVKGKSRPDKKKSMQLLVKKWYDITVTDDCADAIGIGKYLVDKNKKIPKIESWE